MGSPGGGSVDSYQELSERRVQGGIDNLQNTADAYKVFDEMPNKRIGVNLNFGATLCVDPGEKVKGAENSSHVQINESQESSNPRKGNFNGGNDRIPPKFEFPTFYGNKFRRWVRKCEKSFAILAIQESQRVEIDTMYESDSIVVRLHGFLMQKSEGSWNELKNVGCARFREQHLLVVIQEFNKRVQPEDIEEYKEGFEELRACMIAYKPNVPESFLVSSYFSGITNHNANSLPNKNSLDTLFGQLVKSLNNECPNQLPNSIVTIEFDEVQCAEFSKLFQLNDIDGLSRKFEVELGSFGSRYMLQLLWMSKVVNKNVEGYGVGQLSIDALLKNEFKWSIEANSAFQKLKHIMTTTPVLDAFYDQLNEQFIALIVHQMLAHFSDVFAEPKVLIPSYVHEHSIPLKRYKSLGSTCAIFTTEAKWMSERIASSSRNLVAWQLITLVAITSFPYDRGKIKVKDWAHSTFQLVDRFQLFGYGVISRTLTELLKRNALCWSVEAKQSFQQLNVVITSVAMYGLPDFTTGWALISSGVDVIMKAEVLKPRF